MVAVGVVMRVVPQQCGHVVVCHWVVYPQAQVLQAGSAGRQGAAGRGGQVQLCLRSESDRGLGHVMEQVQLEALQQLEQLMPEAGVSRAPPFNMIPLARTSRCVKYRTCQP